MLDVHLEQISLSCDGINSLTFPPPKIFTRALLANVNITSLIRDTEVHERALFSVPAPSTLASAAAVAEEATAAAAAATAATTIPPVSSRNRRQTVFQVVTGHPPVHRGSSTAGPSTSRHTAVAAVLGGALHSQLLREPTTSQPQGGDVNLALLLQGAERLCEVYDLPGARDKISGLRYKHAQLGPTLAYYEAKVDEQTRALEALKQTSRAWTDHDGEDSDDEDGEDVTDEREDEREDVTDEELQAAEAEVAELNRKKRKLEQRLRDIGHDLEGLP